MNRRRPATEAIERPESQRERLLRPWPDVGARSVAVTLLIALVYAWGFQGTEFRPGGLWSGRNNILDFSDRLFSYPYASLGPVELVEVESVNRLGQPVVVAQPVPVAGWARTADRVPLVSWFIDFSDADGDGTADTTILAGPDFDMQPFTLDEVPIVGLFARTPSADDPPLPEVMLPESIPAIVETFQMAIVGTAFGILLSLTFGYLGARNMMRRRFVYRAVRLLLNINRALPEIIWALIFVGAVGLGPFAGVLALAIGSIGALGKVYAEAFESIDPQPVLAVRATGAGGILAFLYGVLPQAAPIMISYSLLYFEGNVRRASILGIVGAGGIGFILDKYVRLFQYSKLMGALIILIVLVTVIDRVSDRIRQRLI